MASVMSNGRSKSLDKAIVRPPSANFADGLTTVHLGAPDFRRAFEQYEAYCAALETCGLSLVRLEADHEHPDSTFVEDTAVLTERCAILTRPGAASRVGEVTSIEKALAPFYASSESIRAPGTLDGGDVCEADGHFFIGISERTNTVGAQQLAELLATVDYTSSFVDIRAINGILHLKSGLAYLGDRQLVVIEALAQQPEFHNYDLVRVNVREEYAANCVRVNDFVLVGAGYPIFEGTLRKMGFHTLALDMTEFKKMDGGLSCLSLRF